MRIAGTANGGIPGNINRSDVSLKAIGGNRYSVSVAAPLSAYDLAAGHNVPPTPLTLTADRAAAGVLALTDSNTDHLTANQRKQVYQILTKGIGTLRFSVSPDSSDRLNWALGSMLDGALTGVSFAYLINACPSIFYVLGSDQESLRSIIESGLLRNALTGGGARKSIRDSLAKCDTDKVWSVYEQAHIVPTHITPEDFIKRCDDTGTDIMSTYMVPVSTVWASPLFDPVEASFLLRACAERESLSDLLSDLVTNFIAQVNWVAPHVDSPGLTARYVLKATEDEKFVSSAHYLENLLKYMRRTSPDDFPFLTNLLEQGLAFDLPYIKGLVNYLERSLISVNWREFILSL